MVMTAGVCEVGRPVSCCRSKDTVLGRDKAWQHSAVAWLAHHLMTSRPMPLVLCYLVSNIVSQALFAAGT